MRQLVCVTTCFYPPSSSHRGVNLYSRLKKIKCLQPSPETKCEACKAAKIPCRFRDRERYFAERSRAIAGPHVPSAYSEDQRCVFARRDTLKPSYSRCHRSDGNPSLDAFSVASGSSTPSRSNPRSSHSPKPSGVAYSDGESNGRYGPYPSDSRRSSERSVFCLLSLLIWLSADV